LSFSTLISCAKLAKMALLSSISWWEWLVVSGNE